MSRHKMHRTLAVAALALMAGASFAQGTFREDARDSELAARIEQGRASGSLTPREVEHLRREQERIRHVEWRNKRDGVVTRGEREQVRLMQDRLSEDISHEKHNGRADYR
ncbi:MAG: hypothetical protein ACTHL8_15740 [Burkholderiaceae bacterium]